MFFKSLFFLLLGSTLILAHPTQERQEENVNHTILGTFAGWLQKADESLHDAFEKVKQPFQKLYNAAIGTGEGLVEFGKDKVLQLLQKLNDLKNKSEASLSQAKSALLEKIAKELEKINESLTDNTNTKNLEELKKNTKEIAEKSKEALKKLEEQVKKVFEHEKSKMEENLDKWQSEANQLIEKKN